MVLDNLRYFATLARHVPGLPAGQYVRGFESVMRREPAGVCGCVTPWNYPLAMAVWKLGPALAAGNCLVLKPADTTPVTTSMLAEIIGEHLPEGCLCCGNTGAGFISRLPTSSPNALAARAENTSTARASIGRLTSRRR